MISVILPIYNVEKYLNKCIDSIVRQSYKDLQIILVNDGSTDTSPDICSLWESKDKRICVINQSNSGVSAARNAGLLKAKGEYITFVDPDDYLENEMYERMLFSIEKTKADAVFCGYYLEHETSGNKKSFPSMTEEFEGNHEETIYQMLREDGFMTAVWNKLFKKESLISKINGQIILFDTDIIMSEDELWLMSIAENLKKVSFLSEPLYHWIRRQGTACTTCLSDNSITKHNLDQYKISRLTYEKCVGNDRLSAICGAKMYAAGFLIQKKAFYAKDMQMFQKVHDEIKNHRSNWKRMFLKSGKQRVRVGIGILLMNLRFPEKIVRLFLK